MIATSLVNILIASVTGTAMLFHSSGLIAFKLSAVACERFYAALLVLDFCLEAPRPVSSLELTLSLAPVPRLGEGDCFFSSGFGAIGVRFSEEFFLIELIILNFL
jgi:hypothetical protein